MGWKERSGYQPILIKKITEIFLKAGYPKRFIQVTVNNFRNQTGKEEREIPEYMFVDRKKIFIKSPYSQDNKKLSKRQFY